ncbi:MAG: hypothetical protein JF563_05165 [Acidobacteriales bacterium]|nr:hypothetical protein [Terriglobales bacterium]
MEGMAQGHHQGVPKDVNASDLLGSTAGHIDQRSQLVGVLSPALLSGPTP